MLVKSLNFKQGDIVVADIRYSDFESSKFRPALVASCDDYNRVGNDIILIKITSKIKDRPYDVLLAPEDLEFGKIKTLGAIKSDFLVVLEKKLIKFVIGRVRERIIQEVKHKLKEVFCIN